MLELAQEKGLAEDVGEELGRFKELMDGSQELQAVLQNPAIRRGERLAVMGKLIEHLELSQLTSNFLRLMVEKGRAGAIATAVDDYGTLLDKAVGRVHALVTSSRELGAGELDALRTKLEELTGNTVILDQKVDPSIMGGMVTRVGSLVFDGSVRGRLDALRDRLIAEASR
jgi:F-type H+-transporting ATPase subunit delta